MFEDPVLCFFDRFEVGEGFPVECVVAVAAVFVLVIVATSIFWVVDDVFEFSCFAVLDDEDGFPVFFSGSLQVV